ncbi:VCBS repeat-containing protein [Leptothoe sp. EHU-05/26/07-4]
METTTLGSQDMAVEQSNITFTDIVTDVNSGIDYSRVESERNAIFEQLRQQPVFTPDDLPNVPLFARGLPGVAVLDYDDDGDLDVYVTNGPGATNSLYSNQLKETGQLSFVDVAQAVGVSATDQDSNGVVYGDIDNDGDHDLLVLGSGEPNRLFENQGDGTFVDITEFSGIGGGDRYSSSASFGDVNGDGLLDIVVANAFDFDNIIPIVAEPFALNEHNQLFINTGNNTFVDASATSGIENLTGFSEGVPDGVATITWAISLVDYDLDGDLDIIQADDQAAVPPAEPLGGVDRGLIHILQNDGTGNFTDVTVEANLDIPGAWMGLSFGDFNADGNLDIFVSNFGDYEIATPPNLLLVVPDGF